MNLYEDLLKDGTVRIEGDTIDDIAKQFNELVAEIKSTEEKKAKANASKNTLLGNYQSAFTRNCDNECLNMADVARLAALVASPSYPNWTEEDIANFVAAVEENVQFLAEIQGKSISESIKALTENYFDTDIFDKLFPNKSRENKQKCGNTCSCKTVKSDAERIKEFLKNL